MKMCFECLQKRIESDFSGKLNFIYGVSDCPLPFGSQAVVQASDSTQQYLLNYAPYYRDDCFSKYVDEYCVLEGGDRSGTENMKVLDIKEQDEVNVGINSRILGKGCEACTVSNRFSCSRTITSLAPVAQIGNTSSEFFEELVSSYSNGSTEDHILQSLILFIEGKTTGTECINFLSLIGLPSFTEKGFPGCIRHPNVAPILGILRSSSQICMVIPKTAHTLENVNNYSPGALKSEWHVKLLVYQILSALAYLHGLGISHGNLCPSNVMLSDTFWCWLQVSEKQFSKSRVHPVDENCDSSTGVHCFEGCSSAALYADLRLSSSINWQSNFYSWWKGELSNFEYLLILNKLAGRRWGDHTFYTVMPWVVDFCIKPDENNDVGWRDLSKSKWRLAKGDEQLDFTYSTSETAHHVSDECLSELAVCSYKARRLPLSILRVAVRSVYEPNEYPSSMRRLYQWSPDECIPEFYCDPRIFSSIHSGMPDLAVPSWADTPEKFIKLHRNALESERVSRQLHHWIDITFGYKMSGEAAIAAKNVMLPASTSETSRSTGRRQLFSQPHPPRQIVRKGMCERKNRSMEEIGLVENLDLLTETNDLNNIEATTSFVENSWYLSPCYNISLNDCLKNDTSEKEIMCDSSEILSPQDLDLKRNYVPPLTTNANDLLENFIVDDDNSMGYQELLLWRQNSSSCKRFADDIFSVGCILAEIQLKKPLLGLNSLASYLENGDLATNVKELPYHTQVIVEACIQKDRSMRPSAKCLLESPYFPTSIKSSYLFLAAFHLLAKDEYRLQYAATFAKRGVLKTMGAFGAEICAHYCLPLLVTSSSDAEADWSYILLSEFLKCLNFEAVKKLVVPSIQSILQATGYSRLKVSLLQGSFMLEIWNIIGKQAYLATIHPLIISNLCVGSHTSTTSAASVLLIGSSEELGVPITAHQTVLPLILCFGKGLCNDATDVLIRIGGLFGERFVVKQVLPLLQNVIRSCLNSPTANKPEPMQSWGCLALIDCLTTIDGIVPVLTNEKILKELIEDEHCPYVKILMQKDMPPQVLQNTAESLIRVCHQIGPDLTAPRVLPRLKELFDELAFSQKNNSYSIFLDGNLSGSRVEVVEEDYIKNRMDIVLLLYRRFASLLGIEKLRKCCATWLIFEQILLRHHNWKVYSFKLK